MSTVTGLGTTYNLPNYQGQLISITPDETPLLSAAGGLSGGGAATKSPYFEWQYDDLRAPENRDRLEGAAAPDGEERARSNEENVCQIFQESVHLSYSKLAATGLVATPSSAPYGSAADGNPVLDEMSQQSLNAVKTIARDVNYTFWHGKKAKPSSNGSARKTAGLLSVAGSRSAGGEVTGLSSGASNIISETSTGVANNDKIVFTAPPAELRPDRVYHVVNKATDSFKVAETQGGSALTIADSQTGIAYIPADNTLSVDGLEEFMQGIYDLGGISEAKTATLFVSARQKRALTKVYAGEYAKANPLDGTRNLAGVTAQVLQTNYGLLNVVIDRALPPDAIAVVSAEQLRPRFLEIPGKGVLFEEELGRTGASVKKQIYGEIGLEYGNKFAHGVIRGLAV